MQVGKDSTAHHNAELNGFSCSGEGSQEGALFSTALIAIPILEQLAACSVALGSGQLAVNVVMGHDVHVAVQGTEDKCDGG